MSDKRFHIRTYTERDDDGQWYCACDVGEIIAAIRGLEIEEVEGIRAGPFPSRQVARQELRGKFRRLVIEATQAFVKKSGGKFERFEVN